MSQLGIRHMASCVLFALISVLLNLHEAAAAKFTSHRLIERFDTSQVLSFVNGQDTTMSWSVYSSSNAANPPGSSTGDTPYIPSTDTKVLFRTPDLSDIQFLEDSISLTIPSGETMYWSFTIDSAPSLDLTHDMNIHAVYWRSGDSSSWRRGVDPGVMKDTVYLVRLIYEGPATATRQVEVFKTSYTGGQWTTAVSVAGPLTFVSDSRPHRITMEMSDSGFHRVRLDFDSSSLTEGETYSRFLSYTDNQFTSAASSRDTIPFSPHRGVAAIYIAGGGNAARTWTLDNWIVGVTNEETAAVVTGPFIAPRRKTNTALWRDIVGWW